MTILGINAVGHESANASITDGRALPWLQDVADEDVWGTWKAEWRDAMVLDAANEFRSVFNLTEHDLSDPANMDALEALVREASE